MKILVADDSHVVRVQLRRLLEGMGHEVVEAQDGLEAMAHIKALQGILPICIYCHKIRDDEQLWQRLEHYLSEHTDLVLSHGVCPECTERMRRELQGE